ncbi:uncharacterized protein F4822DRAFT_385163 [Hypoxylon trugodes]|uniref:uncharacterized protein n=1 Tax=Hypoxylon trugodes TaxID=326681 RepID=UPI0021964C38|nr:uncharacterized protein F4822DRAFT_385163 [Hypoxylon trugodes]KAI1393591.1 hypothetical protein F4822DRAFT_385163 [Hypoxylon trugodes]
MNVPRASLRQWQRLSCLRPSAPRVHLPVCRRSYSESKGSLAFDTIRSEMLGRNKQYSWDVMSPTNSSLLNISLADFIPESCQAPTYRAGAKSIEKVDATVKLPQGHHLVYFPLQKPVSELCPDMTDPLHSPGGPFERRMWAGGSIEFNDDFQLDSTPVVCEEAINDVTIKGIEGQEKIFVDVLRDYMKKQDFESSKSKRIREHRTLVFMRGVNPEQARASLLKASEKRGRIVKVPNAPDFSITLTPTPTLLFNYSALTFNAHLIHLDPEFCREEEGHPNLLVHGPLSLTLMLSVLRSRLGADEKVHRIDYRNLAPLYVNNPMRVCVRLIGDGDRSTGEKTRKWEVWAEGYDGGLSVRGTAVTGPSA